MKPLATIQALYDGERHTSVKLLLSQALVGSFPFWYYDVRIGWLGMIFWDKISMRWMDLLLLVVFAASGLLFVQQSQIRGSNLATRLFRVAMLLSFSLTACAVGAVIISFIYVPYVPASFPPATPATWISMTLQLAAPLVGITAMAAVVLTLIHKLWSR